MCSLEPLKGISLKKIYLVKKMYNYEKYLLKTLKFEEPYVGTSVENQIWLSNRMAGVHISDIQPEAARGAGNAALMYMLKTLITGSTCVSL